MRLIVGILIGMSVMAAASWANDIFDPSGVQRQQERMQNEQFRQDQSFFNLQQQQRQMEKPFGSPC